MLEKKLSNTESAQREALQMSTKGCAFDADEFLRVLEDTRKVLDVYTSAESTLAIVSVLPDIKNKIEVNAMCLKNTIDIILSFAVGSQQPTTNGYWGASS